MQTPGGSHRARGQRALALTALALLIAPVLAGGFTASAADERPDAGTPLWAARLAGDGSADAAFVTLAVAASPDSARAFVTGYARDADATRVVVAALDAATGDVLWKTVDALAAGSVGTGFSLAASPDGSRVFVSGYVKDAGARSGYDALTLAVDAATGDVAWRATFTATQTAGADLGLLTAVTPDGSRVITGGWAQGVDRDFVAVAYDAATGAREWVARHDAGGSDTALALALAPDGSRAFLAGWSEDRATGATHPLVVAVDARTGALVWAHRDLASRAGDGWPFPGGRVGVTPDGGRVLLADSTRAAEDGEAAVTLIALDARTGEPAWRTRATVPGVATGVTVSGDGARAFVASAEEDDFVTRAFDVADGATLWTARFDGEGGGRDVPLAVALAPKGERVHVTGLAAGGPDGRAAYATVAYDPVTGAEAWRAAYDHVAGRDLAWSSTVTPDSRRLLVTGESGGDSGTVAFATGFDVGITLAPHAQDAVTGVNGEARYPVAVTSTGNLPETFHVTLATPAGWRARLVDADARTVDALALAPGERADLALVVWPPVNRLSGSAWVNVTLTASADPRATVTAATLTTVDPFRSDADAAARTPRVAPACATEPRVDAAPPAACGLTGTAATRGNAALDAAEGARVPGVSVPADAPALPSGMPADLPYPALEAAAFASASPRLREPASPEAPGAAATAGPVNGPRDHPGAWESAADLPGEVVHAGLMPDGRVSFIGFLVNAHVWDPGSRLTTKTFSTNSWLFCAGHALLADGRWFAAGGTRNIGFDPFFVEGHYSTEIFDPVTESWTYGPNMSYPRWYPTAVTLADGKVAVMNGIDREYGRVRPVEVYDPATNAFEIKGERWMLDYSKAYVRGVDGKVFIPSPGRMSFTWDPVTGAFENVAERLGDVRYGGGSALLDAHSGKVIEFGGSKDPWTAEVFDPATGRWAWTDRMAYPRIWPDAVLLPNGDVLAVGGELNESRPIPLEYYDVESGEWIEGPNPGTHFAYHGTTLLLPDGSVLATNQVPKDVRIYKPWYFFAGDRIRLVDAPAEVAYGDGFTFTTPDAERVRDVVLVRFGSVTHSLNTDSRRVSVDFVSVPGYPFVNAVAPGNAALAPPGYYMLFALDAEGVPSEAKIVRLGPHEI